MTHEDREHITRDDYSCLSIAVHTYLERELDSYIGHNPCCHGFCLLCGLFIASTAAWCARRATSNSSVLKFNWACRSLLFL